MPTVFRVDPTSVMTTAGNVAAGGDPALFAVAGATVQLFTDAACTIVGTAYTDATGNTACPAQAPVTLPGSSVPSSVAGSQGQFGFWLAAGTYYYRLTLADGGVFSGFPISAGGGATSTPVSLPFLVSTDFDFTPVAPGGSLIIGVNVITFPTVPAGVSGANTGHLLYVSGGVGTAEACLIVGGSGVPGQHNGQILISCANTHSGAWTIQSATVGGQEAIRSVTVASGLGSGPSVLFPAGQLTFRGTLTNDNYSSIIGAGNNSTVFLKGFASGDLILVGSASSPLSGVGSIIRDLQIRVLPGITDTSGYAIHVDWRYNVTVQNVTIYGDPNPGIGQIKNGIKFENALTFSLLNAKILNVVNIGLELASTPPDQTTGRIVAVDVTSPSTNNDLVYFHGNILSMFIDGLQMQGGLNNWEIDTTGGAFTESQISNIIFDSATGTAFKLHGTGNTFKINITNVCLSTIQGAPSTVGMSFDGTGAGVFSDFTLSNITGGVNASNSIGTALIVVFADNFLLSNSQIQGAGGGVGDTSVQISGDTKNVNVSGCVLGYAYDGGKTGSEAYRAFYVPSGTHAGMKVTGCRIFGDAAAFSIAGAHTLSDFSGNTLESGGTTTSFTGSGSVSFGNIGDPAGLNGPVNYIATEGGADNAITGTLSGATLADGLVVTVQLAHTLQAGANTFALNGGTARAIKKSTDPAADIGTGYARTGRIRLMYNTTGPAWMDMSQ